MTTIEQIYIKHKEKQNKLLKADIINKTISAIDHLKANRVISPVIDAVQYAMLKSRLIAESQLNTKAILPKDKRKGFIVPAGNHKDKGLVRIPDGHFEVISKDRLKKRKRMTVEVDVNVFKEFLKGVG